MTDRELLELAAKAAGQERSIAGDLWSNALGKLWDPLTDDGDALRLAVKLGMSMILKSHGFKGPTTWIRSFSSEKTEYHGSDPCAATRRCIVKAAAEIGKEMK